MMNRWVSGMGSPHRPGVAHRRALRADGPAAGARHANGNRAGIGGTVRGNAAGREQREHAGERVLAAVRADRKSTRLNSSHLVISYAVFCLKKKKKKTRTKTYVLLHEARH